MGNYKCLQTLLGNYLSCIVFYKMPAAFTMCQCRQYYCSVRLSFLDMMKKSWTQSSGKALLKFYDCTYILYVMNTSGVADTMLTQSSKKPQDSIKSF